jgi:drug/metabolite transporter (DMT)-like permease
MTGLSFPEVNAVRSFGYLGTMILFVLFQGKGITLMETYAFLLLTGSTLLGNVIGDVLYLSSIDKIGVGRAVAVTSTYPLVVTAFSAIWLKETVTVPILIGTVSVILGLNLLCKERGSGPEGNQTKKGFFLALATALCWGISIPMTRWLLLDTGLSSMDLNFWRAIIFLPSVWILWILRCRLGYHSPRRVARLPLRTWLELNAAGAIALALGGTFLAGALQRAPASVVTPITASSPLISTLLAIVLMGEKSTRRQWAGIVLIVVGSAVISA